MRKITIAAATTALLASAATADSASLAAPGDCAQPIRDLDTGPVSALPIAPGIAGPPAAHFAPVAAVGDAVRVQPVDLTRTLQTTTESVLTESTSLLGQIVAWLDPISPTTPMAPAEPMPSSPPLPIPSLPILPIDPSSPTLPIPSATPLPLPLEPIPRDPVDPIDPVRNLLP